ncbi:cyclin-C isoform X2 [Apis laboriosa]|uniref:cyclin-C isoform X2 n=1 Tax=Apis laboriosa TaxID=183418 RepID=UPI001CC72F61|nr:cyclin-C isoform X2 [Apis laboriosa]
MAGNFWQSSHHQQWLLDKQDLVRERQHDLSIFTEEEYQKLFIFFSNLIQVLGEQLKLRQQVIATATVYFKRFYARNSLKCIDPLLLAPTSVFLASKVEEFGVISHNRLIAACQTVDIGPDEQLLTLAWRIINDSLRTDVCLLYPPHQIAIGCLQIACVILQKDLKAWFAELNADMEKIQEIARYIINLYELWKTYDEKKEIQGLLSKMPKPTPSPPQH